MKADKLTWFQFSVMWHTKLCHDKFTHMDVIAYDNYSFVKCFWSPSVYHMCEKVSIDAGEKKKLDLNSQDC